MDNTDSMVTAVKQFQRVSNDEKALRSAVSCFWLILARFSMRFSCASANPSNTTRISIKLCHQYVFPLHRRRQTFVLVFVRLFPLQFGSIWKVADRSRSRLFSVVLFSVSWNCTLAQSKAILLFLLVLLAVLYLSCRRLWILIHSGFPQQKRNTLILARKRTRKTKRENTWTAWGEGKDCTWRKRLLNTQRSNGR